MFSSVISEFEKYLKSNSALVMFITTTHLILRCSNLNKKIVRQYIDMYYIFIPRIQPRNPTFLILLPIIDCCVLLQGRNWQKVAKKFANAQHAALICSQLWRYSTLEHSRQMYSRESSLRFRESGYINNCKPVNSEILAHFDFIPKYSAYQVGKRNRGCHFSAYLPSVEIGRTSCRKEAEDF